MKLRNRKTGRVGDFDIEHIKERGAFIKVVRNDVPYYQIKRECETLYYYDSLAELNEEWEDHKPAEPLIKDEKIRKAVRAWAEVNELEPDYEVKYSENSFALISWQANIDFNTQIKGLEHNKEYTITELCGEEEE